MKQYYLYKITNLINGKMYIGITTRPEDRFKQHMRGKSSVLLKNAVNKYGTESFKFEILVIGDKEYIADLERKAIVLYKTQNKEFGYNIKPGGEGMLAGYKIPKTKRDKPCFASGFWFPNFRTAVESLGVDKSTLIRRRKDGVMGDIVQSNLKQNWEATPVYVTGFWWQSVFVASGTLGVSKEALKYRIKRGSIEQAFTLREQTGASNHMFGISPEKHPSSKPVSIDGTRYNTLKEASELTGISKYILRKRLKEGKDAFFLSKEE